VNAPLPPPLIVVDTMSLEELEPAAERLRASGWRVVDGLHAPPLDSHRTVVRGLIVDRDSCAAAVLAAAWGGGILVGIGALDDGTRHRLLDDLGRLGPVERHSVAPWPADGAAGGLDGALALDPDGERLLELLASGRSLGEAASALHLSRRTADRRLAAARRALGAETTPAAISAFARRRLHRP
jgi:DNA-binding CsgD family transcriptional regulator